MKSLKTPNFSVMGRQGSTSALSAMTILIKGKTLNQAKKLTEDDILKELEGLPNKKIAPNCL